MFNLGFLFRPKCYILPSEVPPGDFVGFLELSNLSLEVFCNFIARFLREQWLLGSFLVAARQRGPKEEGQLQLTTVWVPLQSKVRRTRCPGMFSECVLRGLLRRLQLGYS